MPGYYRLVNGRAPVTLVFFLAGGIVPSPIGPLENNPLMPILELTRRLAAPTDLRAKLTLVIDAARDVLHADRGSVFLYDAGTDELYSEVATGEKQIRFPADKGIAGRCARSRAIVNVPDCYADPDFNPDIDRKTGYRTRCSLSIPLIGLKDELVGVLQVLNKLTDPSFSEADIQIAACLAAQAGVSLQTARVQKMEKDMALAKEIQARVLPTEVPQLPGYELAGWSQPADETGGDIYDVVPVNTSADGGDSGGAGGAMLLLGDATGHGIGPALSVTQVRAMLRIAMRLDAKLEDIFRHVNDQLCDDLPANRFVTVFMGMLDAADHRLRYHSGGQGPLVHFHAADGSCDFLDASTFPLGIMPGVMLDQTPQVTLAPGDIFALLSDGIYEYADPDGKQFATTGVQAVLREHHHAPMPDLIHRFREAVTAHAQKAPQLDDMTILLVKRTA